MNLLRTLVDPDVLMSRVAMVRDVPRALRLKPVLREETHFVWALATRKIRIQESPNCWSHFGRCSPS